MSKHLDIYDEIKEAVELLFIVANNNVNLIKNCGIDTDGLFEIIKNANTTDDIRIDDAMELYYIAVNIGIYACSNTYRFSLLKATQFYELKLRDLKEIHYLIVLNDKVHLSEIFDINKNFNMTIARYLIENSSKIVFLIRNDGSIDDVSSYQFPAFDMKTYESKSQLYKLITSLTEINTNDLLSSLSNDNMIIDIANSSLVVVNEKNKTKVEI
ncbi:hypothetical protein RW115_12070 [Macrococcus capreoli]